MTTASGAPTQHDVAARAGCSQRAVSIAFGGSGTISAALRGRIVEAATALDYRPHAGARELRLGRSRPVALIQSTNRFSSWLPEQLLLGLETGLAAQGRHLAVVRLSDSELLAKGGLPARLESLGADGLLLNYDGNVPSALPDLIAQYRIPAVWLNSRQPGACVYPDDHQAGTLMAQHLLDLGHRRLLWSDLTGWHGPVRHRSHQERWSGFQAAALARGARVELQAPTQAQPYAVTMGQLTDFMCKGRVTGVGTYSELEATSVHLAAERNGLSVPGALSLITTHVDTTIAGLALTYVRNPMREVGEAAAGLLLTPGELAIPFSLQVHGSTASAPA